MDLSEEVDQSPGLESTELSRDPIQSSIVEKKVEKAKPKFRNEKGKRWEKIFVFDKTGMSKEEIVKEQDRRRKEVRAKRGKIGKTKLSDIKKY